MKRLFWLFGMAAMVTTADAQFTYTTNGGSIIVSGYTGSGGSVVIPSTANGMPVVGIGDNAFAGKSITSVYVPSSIVSIGNYAFNGCKSLSSAYISQGVTLIGNGAFRGCATLASVSIPNSVMNIGIEAFSSCTNLSSVVIPTNITSINDNTFYGCSHLSSANIPNGVTSIGSSVFNGCASLSNVSIPSSVTSVGFYAFSGCYNLTSITIPCGLTDKFVNPSYNIIDYSPTPPITAVTVIPSSVTSIAESAFKILHPTLTSITISNGVTSIGESAFWACSKLSSLTIPSSVTSIGNSAFYDCSGLTSLTISNGVTSIGDYAFCYCKRLSGISIPSSVRSIGPSAFASCSSLTSILFQGNAPTPSNDTSVFSGTSATAYYYYGKTGWGETFDGIPTTVYGSVPNATPPALGICAYGSNSFPAVFFPTATGINFLLETTTNLNGPWQALTNGVPISGFIITNGQPAAFFRLR